MRFLPVRAFVCAALAVSTFPVFASTPQNQSVTPHVSPRYRTLRGEGVVITLSDRLAPLPRNLGQPVMGLVHDRDVMMLVSELRQAGAYGITVGGVRLTKSSVVRCIGPNLFVDRKPIAVPVRIEAIGNAARLKGRLWARAGVVNSLKATGPHIYLSVSSDLQLKPAPLRDLPKSTSPSQLA